MTEQQAQPFTPSLRENPAEPCLKPIKIFCDSILWFENKQHYEMVYQCLEQAYEAHNDWFDQQTQNMSDDDAEAHAAYVGFNEDQPLMDFEAFQNFYSYRRWLDTHEETWANQGINSLTYNYTLDYIHNTLISKSRMIRIGSITYYYHSDSETYVIKTEDCSVIDLAKNDIESAVRQYENQVSLLLPTKKEYNPNCGFYLGEEDRKSGTVYYQMNNQNQRYDWKMNFKWITLDPQNNNFVKRSFLFVQMNNFIQRNNEQWRRKRVDSSAEGYIYFFNDDWFNCDHSHTRSTGVQTYNKRRKRTNRIIENTNVNLFISDKENFETFGSFRKLGNSAAAHHAKLLTN